jgi:hypothetical protein
MILAAFAPGNQVRQSAYTKMHPAAAVLKSLFYGFLYITRTEWGWIKAPAAVVTAMIFLVPFMAPVIKRANFKFKYPLLVLLVTFGLFSAQFTPTLFATSGSGPLRLKNIIFYVYLWFLLFNFTYLSGWLYHKIKDLHQNRPLFDSTLRAGCKKSLGIFLLVCMFFGGMFVSDTAESLTGVIAAKSLISGEARQFDAEYQERLAVLESDQEAVSLKPYSAVPDLLQFSDITNPPDWKNGAVAMYFEKTEVTLAE